MTTMTVSLPMSLAQRVVVPTGLLSVLRQAIARRRAYLETRRELSWLSDRELADLGITRCDVDRIARAAAYGN